MAICAGGQETALNARLIGDTGIYGRGGHKLVRRVNAEIQGGHERRSSGRCPSELDGNIVGRGAESNAVDRSRRRLPAEGSS